MTKFCTITPTRGDRPEFLEFCKHQLSRMTVKPDHSYFIDHEPINSNKDLVTRVKMGVEIARSDGFDYAFIIEDDDYYAPDYFSRIDFTADFYGDQETLYYHLGNTGYQLERHKGRSSLFTTGFKLSSLNGFDFGGVRKVFVDVSLWDYARRKRKTTSFINAGAVGIKHGIGLTGGIGHRDRIYKKFDHNWSLLSSLVDSDALEFYKGMHKKLCG